MYVFYIYIYIYIYILNLETDPFRANLNCDVGNMTCTWKARDYYYKYCSVRNEIGQKMI